MQDIEETRVHTRKATITEWYVEVFPSVAVYIQKNGGKLEEAKEAFQEAIVLYYEQLNFTGFKPDKNHKAYLFGIAKNRWLKQCKDKSRYEPLLDRFDTAEVKEEQLNSKKLLHYLKQTGEKCLNMLQAFYYEKLTTMQLADRFGYTSERSATVQKYKCLEKVRDQVKSKALGYEDFLS